MQQLHGKGSQWRGQIYWHCLQHYHLQHYHLFSCENICAEKLHTVVTNFCNLTLAVLIIKTAQSLQHHNSATVEYIKKSCGFQQNVPKNSLHNKNQYLNTASKYSLFCSWQVNYSKTVLTLTSWSIKTCHLYFFNSSVKHWPILIIFGMRHGKETWCKLP